MTAKIIDGKSIAEKLLLKVKEEISDRRMKGINPPVLAVILIGNDPASQVYVRNKKIACEKVGIESISYDLAENISQDELLLLVNKLNSDPTITGILVQAPLPGHIIEDLIIDAIHPNKDIDGFHPLNMGLLVNRQPKLRPCTPYGVIKMLKASNIVLKGLDATIVGVSNHVGRPMALELLMEGCTTTSCHSRTKNLEQKVNQADLVIVAAGKHNLVRGEWIKEGAIVVDIGINRINGKLVGDVEFETAKERASYITPVPGGVGPMTVATLMENTLLAQKLI
ncbi:MAG: bifunctional methylenetetrahydrofolate dehydrogenase/methenyltetrahydrofolate cyclohydrolase FolD [Proteobacteria bacterium]|jgi:methylenetetrahydrofolate dehydrogenase (NADP+) / methenyltetrahydrofolate cyclohydrolase|nr:bifunctional methylenetetrahydrofolate dehydrogenase/methenyltetrahydrofolate cyclohydrolase FolD [Pseudomonadota bacterium]|tara:strand:- start:147 stop:992 length:846 start_codon:yes stop_codon:yes gene_type:complete